MGTDQKYQFLPFPITKAVSTERPYASVRQFGSDLMTCPFRKRVHRHVFFEVAWLSRGELSFFVDFKAYRLTAGTLIFISPGQVHTLDGDEKDVELTIISFTPDLFSLYGAGFEFLSNLPFYYTTVPPFMQIEPVQQATFDHLFATILRKYDADGPRRVELLCSYLNIIFLEALDMYEAAPTQPPINASIELTHYFRLATERHFVERKQVQAYAELLGVTANHLVKTVRETTGMTPGQILNTRLALEAKRLLVNTADSSATIAHKLAFKNPSQFGRWFKNIEGVSPGQFREQFTVPRMIP